MNQKPLYASIRAKKPLLILALTGVLVISIISIVLSSSVFSDTFNSYNVGNLVGQGSWVSWASKTSAKVQSDQVYEGSKAVKLLKGAGNYEAAKKIGTQIVSGFGSFAFYGIPSVNQYVRFTQSTETKYCNISMGATGSNLLNMSCTASTGVDLTFTMGVWHIVLFEWDGVEKKARMNLDGTGWTVWKTSDFTSFDRIIIYSNSSVEGYLDTFGEEICMSGFCDKCYTPYTCQNADCCWYYASLPEFNVCSDCPSECAGGYYDCAYCLTQETCEEYIPTCYWINGECKYSQGYCSTGLRIVFCTTEEDCTNNGGYWYDDFCWTNPKSTLTSWEDYYDIHGEGEVPTEFVNGLAASIGDFISKVGGFLTTFNASFDKRAAYQRGQDFGSYLPIARGYLGILDTFAGNLPIGDFFLFVLIFMLAVGVFRVVRIIIQLIKLF